MKNFILLIIVLFSITESFSQVNLNSGLVAYYPFNANTNDASGNGNNAVFNNATLASDRLGNPNSAYSFNGIDNYIKIPNSSSLNTGSQISLCAYVKINGFYSGGCHGNDIINKGQYENNTGFYFMRFDDEIYSSGANCFITVDSIHQNFYGHYTAGASPGYTPYIVKDEWYCLIYTYDGITAKFFVNGNLKSQANISGLNFGNNDDLYLGRLFDPSDPPLFPYWFNGVMDEVRIYNRALNDQEVTALCTKTTNTNITAGFNAPDTVCLNSPVSIQNTSQGATNYFWNFCTANINQPPTGTNLGNVGGLLSAPVYMDYVFANGNYYGFVTNNNPGGLLRLDFGNSLLNTPTVTSLGNVGGAVPNNTEGVQIANDNGNWYVLIVGGDAGAGSTPSLTTVSLGANIANNSPTAVNWGNIGNLSYPHDLYVFNDNGNWYGITVNYSNSTVTLFNLTTSLSNTPTAVNLGNIGNLSGPTGIQAINDNGNWRVFVTNATSSTLTRLDFGASLLNIPTGVNLGNPNNTFVTSWDIHILKYCGENEAYVINANSPDDIVKLDFGSSLLNNPIAVSLGNQGNLNFPHSISRLFRAGADVFSFITNVNNNTLSLLEFKGCINASIPNSTAQTPPAITYNTPGIYNINLTVDDGLPTQTSYCKQVVVKDCQKDTIINEYTPVVNLDICKNEIIVADATKYNVGDTVLIIQMKGAIIDSSNAGTFGNITNYNNAGNYEMNIVKGKNGNSLSLLNLLKRQYDIPNDKVQLIRVPYFKSVTFNNRLTCLPWDGSKGGVVVLNVKDTTTLNADIDVTGKGFSGGNSPNPNTTTLYCNYNDYYYSKGTLWGADKGESIAIIGNAIAWGKGSPANGGGGGNGHNSGGGGGSNGGVGGFGGYQLDACGGSSTDNRGLGGKALVYNNAANKIFMGGGGGSGSTDNSGGSPMNGGNGGGIIIIKSPVLVNTGAYKIIAKGGDASECGLSPINLCHDGSGGGGAAGTVLIENNKLINNTIVDISGGKGGDLVIYNPPGASKIGPGGGGGAGTFWSNNAAIPANIIVNKTGGINGVIIANNNDPYGTTPGQDGLNQFNLKIPVDTILFKPNIDSVKIKDSATSCSNFNFNGIGFTNTSPIKTWQWLFGDGQTAATQNTTHSYSTGGSFTVKLVVTDANGCKDSISKSVTTSSLNITTSNDTTLCEKSSVQLSAGGGISYSWTPVNSLTNPGISNPVANPSVTTTYHVTVTNAVGCTKTDSVKITVSSLPVITKSNDTSICINSSLQLFASGGSAYSWMPAASLNNSNISNPVATPLSNTSYFVKVSNAAGCFKTDSVKITAKNLPVVSTSNDTSICINSSVQLSASGGSSYSWTPSSTLNNPAISNPVANPQVATLYHVTVTNVAGCSKTDSVKILVNTLPSITKSKDAGICNNASIQLTAGGGTSYLWTPAATLSNPDIYNPIATPSATTLYYVTVTNVTGCSKKDSVKITTSDPPVITTSNDTSICKNTSVQIFANGGSTYTWSPASSLNNATISNPTAKPNTSTIYYVTVTNAYGCSKNDSVKIDIHPLPFITVSNDTSVCKQASVKLFATGGNSYLWSPASSLDNPASPTPVASPAAATIYKVVVTDAYSCTYEDSVKVSIKSIAKFMVSPDASVCIATPKQLSASGGDSYVWSPANGLDNANINNPVATPAATTTYTVTIHENACNETATLSTTLTALPLPRVNAFSSNDLTCSLGSSQLTATGASNYTWSPSGSLNNSNVANPVATPSSTTLYTVVGKDDDGCSSKDTVIVKTDYSMKALYLLPNSFTPNGDGINDCFGIKYWGVVQQVDFSIYNRYGERIFYTTDPKKCWDGTYKQHLQDVNVFVYIIKAKTACGYVERKGTVALLK